MHNATTKEGSWGPGHWRWLRRHRRRWLRRHRRHVCGSSWGAAVCRRCRRRRCGGICAIQPIQLIQLTVCQDNIWLLLKRYFRSFNQSGIWINANLHVFGNMLPLSIVPKSLVAPVL